MISRIEPIIFTVSDVPGCLFKNRIKKQTQAYKDSLTGSSRFVPYKDDHPVHKRHINKVKKRMTGINLKPPAKKKSKIDNISKDVEKISSEFSKLSSQ